MADISLASVVDQASFNQFISGFRQVLDETKAAVVIKATRWGGSTPCDIFGVDIEPGGTIDILQGNSSCLNLRLIENTIKMFNEHFVPSAEKGLLAPPGTFNVLESGSSTPYSRQDFITNALDVLNSVMAGAKARNKWAETSYLDEIADNFYESFLEMVDKVIDAAKAVGERIVKRVTSSYWGWLGIGALAFVGYWWLQGDK